MNALGDPTTMSVDELFLYHRNPRRGDVDTIMESIKTNGFYRPLIVNRGSMTGRKNEILAGNHTFQAAKQLGMQTLPVWVVDVDDDTTKRIVIADNRASDLATNNDEDLLGLLTELEYDLTGTGYDEADLEALAESLTPLEEDEPEPSDDDDWTVLKFRVPPMIAHQWTMWAGAYDSPEEAFEALMDKSTNYTG